VADSGAANWFPCFNLSRIAHGIPHSSGNAARTQASAAADYDHAQRQLKRERVCAMPPTSGGPTTKPR